MTAAATEHKLLQGDALSVLRTLPAESVQAIITSPPYFALREYGGGAEEIGTEAGVDEYVRRLVAVFAEARRVLRRDGCCWVNLGDTYRNKQLLGVPWRFAFAAQKDGWFLRGEQIWDKPNACPESCRDRPTRSHEHVFLLTRRAKYWYDREAVRTPNTAVPTAGPRAKLFRNKGESVRLGVGGKYARTAGVKGGFVGWNPRGKNLRSVWRLCTQPFRASTVGVTDVEHFATMPRDLVRLCLRASTPAGGCCPSCGTPQTRVLAAREDLEDAWVPGCSCPPFEPVPAVVLDPFVGSGTTLAVAAEEGRSGIGIDLSAEYLRLAQARIDHARKRGGYLPPLGSPAR